jgi:L-fuconolactonase
LVTEAAPGDGLGELRPVIGTLVEHFGPQRLMWGSDWPVVNLAGGYDRWRAMALAALAGLAPDDLAAVLGGTAAHVYLREDGAAARDSGRSVDTRADPR